MASPITFVGEPPRSLHVSDVDVVVQQVIGQVHGVRAELAKIQGSASIRKVTVHGGDVASGGTVTGVDLT